MPIISVIIPVYKVEPYLCECIDSIQAQTFTDFELILVDDGSPDDCGRICDKYAERDSRIHVIHQLNRGLSTARNAGIEWALANRNSQWITFVDSDDVVCECYLEYLYKIAEQYQAEISSCIYQKFSKSSKVLMDNTKSEKVFLFSSKEACLDIYEDYSKGRINAVGKLINKKLFYDLRFPNGKIHEDQAIIPILLYKAERVVLSQLQLYYYRIRSESIMHRKFSIRRFDDIEAVDACIAFFEAHNEERIARIACRRKRIIIASYNLYAISDGVHREVPKRYKMSELSALKLLKKELPGQLFMSELAKIHPNWIRLYEYLQKIKKMMHISYKPYSLR